jgi:RNA polymerase sigma-70 factor (ECF subfamily)
MAAADADPQLEQIDSVLRAGLEWVALRRLGDAELARDALQETLARTLAALRAGKVPAGVHLPAYATGILRHVVADVRFAQRRPEARFPDPDLADPGPSPLEALITEEEEARVRQSVMAMGPEERELLVRCFVRGEGAVELARSLGMPASRVRKRKSRALSRLRTIFERGADRHASRPPATYRV